MNKIGCQRHFKYFCKAFTNIIAGNVCMVATIKTNGSIVLVWCSFLPVFQTIKGHLSRSCEIEWNEGGRMMIGINVAYNRNVK
jgi:hypothetical protein